LQSEWAKYTGYAEEKQQKISLKSQVSSLK
jgi:hypothetical protein